MLADDARLLRREVLFRDILGVPGAIEGVAGAPDAVAACDGAPLLVRRSLRVEAARPRCPSICAPEAVRPEAAGTRLASADSSPRLKEPERLRVEPLVPALAPNSDASEVALSRSCRRRCNSS